jgi:hypothetical protein
MAADHFHLAWFLQGSSVQAWGEPWTGNISEDWMSADMFLDLARSIERACFDYLLIEDSIYVGETWRGSREIYLKNGMSIPRQEPSVVATLMVAATSRLGIVPTLSTFAYAPYLVARIVGTLDQVSGGRAGWNMVTGSSDLSAKISVSTNCRRMTLATIWRTNTSIYACGSGTRGSLARWSPTGRPAS